MVNWVISVFSKLIAPIGCSYTRVMSDGEQSALRNIAPSGCVIVTRRKWELANLFIPGHYKHAAVILPNFTVLEMTVRFGLVIRPLFELLRESSEYCILRPNFASMEMVVENAEDVYTTVSREYDHMHLYSNDFYDCGELIAVIFHKALGVFSPYKLEERILPSRFVDHKLFDTVAIYDVRRENELQDDI